MMPPRFSSRGSNTLTNTLSPMGLSCISLPPCSGQKRLCASGIVTKPGENKKKAGKNQVFFIPSRFFEQKRVNLSPLASP
jgi:hypothetical protein